MHVGRAMRLMQLEFNDAIIDITPQQRETAKNYITAGYMTP
jgi:hypothetical protein